MILIELTAAVSPDGTLRTFYLTDKAGGFVTGVNDVPARTAFDPAVEDPISIGLHAFGDGRTGGSTKLEVGEITLVNVDGRFDAWLTYAFEGRPVVVRTGVGGAYPSSFTILLSATVDTVETNDDLLVIKIRDKQLKFDTPALTATYGGTNVLPSGLDGNSTDVKGKVRPRAWGAVFNVSPPLVNTSRYIFEVGPCFSVPAAYTNGSPLIADADYTSQADMEANAPVAGHYRVWPAGGYVRLGSYSGEQITVDIVEGASSTSRTVGQVMKRLAINGGLTSAEISDADIGELDALNAAQVGIWIDDGTTTTSALDQLAASLGCWYGFDAPGVLRIGQLSEPSGTPAITLRDHDMLSLVRRAPTDNGRPIWRATVNHTKCYTVQTSGLNGTAATRAAFVNEQFRSVPADDESVKKQWLLAGELSVNTLLTSDADAQLEAYRLRDLYKVRRDIFEVQIDVSVFSASPCRIGKVALIITDRYGMDSGRKFVLIGISFNLAEDTVTLSVWG